MDEEAVRAALQHYFDYSATMEAWEAPEWRARWRAAPPRQPDGKPASDPAADAGVA